MLVTSLINTHVTWRRCFQMHCV